MSRPNSCMTLCGKSSFRLLCSRNIKAFLWRRRFLRNIGFCILSRNLRDFCHPEISRPYLCLVFFFYNLLHAIVEFFCVLKSSLQAFFSVQQKNGIFYMVCARDLFKVFYGNVRHARNIRVVINKHFIKLFYASGRKKVVRINKRNKFPIRISQTIITGAG